MNASTPCPIRLHSTTPARSNIFYPLTFETCHHCLVWLFVARVWLGGEGLPGTSFSSLHARMSLGMSKEALSTCPFFGRLNCGALFISPWLTKIAFYTECIHGEIELIGGNNSLEGRVEICIDGQVTTVCGSLSNASANVVCRQLGFRDSGKLNHTVL